MFEHHASYVIMDLAHKCAEAARRGDNEKAARFANLSSDVGRAYPEAEAEVAARYPSGGSE